ncbi:hypothetical protein BDR22DRAFT_805158, partial [Usnea florida]
NIIPIIKSAIKDLRIILDKIPFINLTPLITNKNLIFSNPNFYYSARLEDLKYKVYKDL